MIRGWPLTGRGEELRFVADALASDDITGVMLAGAAGVGKSRLAREALGVAGKRRAVTRWTVATAATRVVPLGVFSDVVTTPPGAPPDPGLLQRVGRALSEGSPGKRVVVGIDDAHLLDDLSAAVVHQLAVGRTARLVVTVRSGEPAPDAVTALWKDGHLRRLEVQPLSALETTALLEVALGGPVEHLTARRLYAATEGNALFLVQLVTGELECGALREVSGVWQWRGDTTVTPQLVELVEARVGGLADELRSVVEVLAFGEPLGVRLLAELTDPAAVEEAEHRGLVRMEPSGRRLEARLAHPLFGEVLRARTSVLAARRVRGRLAAALAGTGLRRAGDLLRQAALVIESDLQRDPDLLSAAADHAVTRSDMALAERLARASVEAGGGFHAALNLAKALCYQGDPDAAEVVFALLRELADTEGERVVATIPRAANLFFYARQPAQCRQVLDRQLADTSDPTLRNMLSGFRSLVDCSTGRIVEAATRARSVLASPHTDPLSISTAVAAVALADAIAGRGNTVPALVAEHADAAARLTGFPGVPFHQALGELYALRTCGRPDAAEALIERLGQFSEGAVWVEALTAMFRGWAACVRGLPRTSVRWFEQSLAATPESESVSRFESFVGLAQAQAMSGHAVAARGALDAAAARHHEVLGVFEPDLLLARAWVAAAEGALSEAITLAREASTVAAESGQFGIEVITRHTAVRFGDRAAADRLTELAATVDGSLAPRAAEHAAALAADDGAGLDAASAGLEELGARLEAADAAAQAAAAHRRAGKRAAEMASAARAQRLAECCEAARTPALREAAQPLPLTRREREIASLICAGLSNREIAERLVVSVRTVEGHVYRACDKLGVDDRASLATLLAGG